MIVSTGKYVGNTTILMDDIINRYGQENFLRNIVGYESVCIESQKTQVEMAECAIRDCLSKCPEVKREEIGILIFTSNTPCQLIPNVAITLADKIGLRQNDIIAFDLNSNCGGELVALHTAQSIMTQNPQQAKYALIVGCDKFDYARSAENVVVNTYGDSASAVLIDQRPFETYAFLNENNTNYLKELQLPKSGFVECKGELSLYADGNPSLEDVIEIVLPQFHRLLEETDVDAERISAFCWTQGSRKIIETMAEQLGISVDKVPFTGNTIGYSAVACPMMTLDYAIENGMVKRNDLVLLWGLGAGISSTMMLLKY